MRGWSGRLPDGKVTTSTTRYLREWRKIGRAVAKMFGPDCVVTSFDPGFRVSSRDYKFGIEVNMEAARRLLVNKEQR